MIDNLSLAISHGLMLLAAYLLLRRDDLDRDQPSGEPEPLKKRRGWRKPRA